MTDMNELNQKFEEEKHNNRLDQINNLAIVMQVILDNIQQKLNSDKNIEEAMALSSSIFKQLNHLYQELDEMKLDDGFDTANISSPKLRAAYSALSDVSKKFRLLHEDIDNQADNALYERISKLTNLPKEKVIELANEITEVKDSLYNELQYKINNNPSEVYEIFDNYELGKAYTALLLYKHEDVFDASQWAKIAEMSIDHAKLVLGMKSVADKIGENNDLLVDIASSGPGQARLVLDKFRDKLGNKVGTVEAIVECESYPEPQRRLGI